MRRAARDDARESRITMEIICDAHDGDERAMGWHCYLEEKLSFPFDAKCVVVRPTSPLKKGQIVKVSGMTSDDECRHEMFVDIDHDGRALGVPLMQLAMMASKRPSAKARDTADAIADWHYWVARGYEFG